MWLNLIIFSISCFLLILAFKQPKYFISIIYILYVIFYIIVTRYEMTRIGGAIKPLDIILGICIITTVFGKNYKKDINLNLLIVLIFYNLFQIWRGTLQYGYPGVGEGREYILFSALIFYGIFKINRESEIRFIINTMVYLGLFIAVLTIIFFIYNLLIFNLKHRVFNSTHALSILIAYFLSQIYLKNKWSKKLYLLNNFILITAIILLQHRSVWMAFVAAYFLASFIERQFYKIIYLSLIIFIFISGLILFKQSEYSRELKQIYETRLAFALSGYEEDSSGRFRILAWQAEMKKFSSNPLTGSGWGNRIIMHKERGKYSIHIHNGHLTLLSRTGIIGYILFLAFLFSVMKKKRSILIDRYINYCIVGVLIYSLFYPFRIMIWLLILLKILSDHVNFGIPEKVVSSNIFLKYA